MNIMSYLLAFLGFALYIGLGMKKTKQKHAGKKFNPIKYLKDEIITLIISAVSVVILVLLLPQAESILAASHIEYAGVINIIAPVAIGLLNYTIIDKAINIFIPKKFIES